MAKFSSTSTSLTFTLTLLLLISQCLSLICTSQNTTTNFTNCADLPALSSYLHYTYNPTQSSLSISFAAAPPSPSGWISWGINPTATVMLGTQALLAFKHSNGSMNVNTYDISSYALTPSRISFNVSGLRAEESDGTMTIFATLTLPRNTTEVFMVWQTGAGVTDGRPDRHAMNPENMISKELLKLTASHVTTNGNNGTNSRNTNGHSGSPQIAPQSAPGNGGISISKHSVFYVWFLILGVLALV